MAKPELVQLPKGAVVLHLAGRISGTSQTLAENVAMIEPLVGSCRASGAKGVIFASTAAVYPQDGSLGQEDFPEPVNDYGRSKLAAEQELARLAGSMPHLSLRLGNVAGADALLAKDAHEEILLDPVAGREGGPVRSWIGPITLARLLEDLAHKMHSGESLPQIVNVAATPPLKMADILTAAGRKWRYAPPRAGVIASALLATDRLTALCGEVKTSPSALVSEVDRLR